MSVSDDHIEGSNGMVENNHGVPKPRSCGVFLLAIDLICFKRDYGNSGLTDNLWLTWNGSLLSSLVSTEDFFDAPFLPS